MKLQTFTTSLRYYLGNEQFHCHQCGERTLFQRLYLELNELNMYVGDSQFNYCTSCAEKMIERSYSLVAPKQHSYCHSCNNIGHWITDTGVFGFNGPTCPSCVTDILHWGTVERAFGNVYDGKYILNEAGAIVFT